MAARPEVAAPVGPVPEVRVGRLVDPAVTHHPSPSVLDGPVRQPLQPTHKCNSKKPIATNRAEPFWKKPALSCKVAASLAAMTQTRATQTCH